MIDLSKGDKLYAEEVVSILSADGAVSLRTRKVEPGYLLEVYHMAAIGNNSAANELVGLGYTHNSKNYLLDGKINTGDVDYIVALKDKLLLWEGCQPLAYFEAGNNTETLKLVVNGVLKKIPSK